MINSKKRTYFLVSIAIVLAAIAGIIYRTRYSADSSQVTFSGYVYEGLEGSYNQQQTGPAAVGASVYLICPSSDSGCPGTKEYSAAVDSSGHFSITITNPSTCPYRVLVGGGKYGFRDRGSVSFGSAAGSMSMMANQPQIMTVDTETDMMQSYYPGLDGMYPSGYVGAYHFSQYDAYYLRNLIKKEQLLSPKAPTSAKVNINLIDVRPSFNYPENMPGMIPQGLPIQAVIEVHPVLANWTQGSAPSLGPIVGSKDLTIGKGFVAQSLEFTMDLGSLSQEQRYQCWLNGFSFNFRFKGAANYNDMSNLSQIQQWSQINPDLLIGRSEDGTITNVEYSGLADFARSDGGSGFVGPVHKPIDVYHQPGPAGDFGPRIHPVTGKSGFHRGNDLSGSSTVYAFNAGKIASVGHDSAYGLNIKIDHCNGYSTYYNHLKEGSVLVKVGDTVSAGQQIATVDTTGLSTGDHLHFDVSIKGTFVDPWPYLKDL